METAGASDRVYSGWAGVWTVLTFRSNVPGAGALSMGGSCWACLK